MFKEVQKKSQIGKKKKKNNKIKSTTDVGLITVNREVSKTLCIKIVFFTQNGGYYRSGDHPRNSQLRFPL